MRYEEVRVGMTVMYRGKENVVLDKAMWPTGTELLMKGMVWLAGMMNPVAARELEPVQEQKGGNNV